MTSSFAWLDYSEQERRRALDVISLFQVRDTRDELGLAGVRDPLAELLFPGTTTIQTRARYFLFIPWMCRDFERRAVRSSRIGIRFRRAEGRLIKHLSESDDVKGVIGGEAGAAVKRMPSSVYWAGLRRWGILQFQGSQAQYHRSLDEFYVRLKGRQARDRENEASSPEPTNWHPHIPDPPAGFPEGAELRLRFSEAEYLRERILSAALLHALGPPRGPGARALGSRGLCLGARGSGGVPNAPPSAADTRADLLGGHARSQPAVQPDAGRSARA